MPYDKVKDDEKMGGSQSSANPNDVANANTVLTNSKNKIDQPHTVIIPVDGSNQSEVAFQWYMHHCHKPENIVRVLHCTELAPSSPLMIEHTFKTDSWVSMMEKARADGVALVNKYEKKLEDNGIQGSVHFEIGKPGEVVINAADKYCAHHIVMGSRGFGIIRRTLLGSVSEYVIHNSDVPVTVVPKESQRWFR